MPCWYYEKKEIKNSPSFQDGIDSGTEARYRRDGARFIIDAGTKMGLRNDTCGTGVVYFHRFYMFHSFREFPRFVTAACCLFLAGKVEETPKKCKDIIKISQQLLTPAHFATFGDDPKEEVMTLERILLQTIKFDLQVEHPYSYLLKFAKGIKADKEKVQKLVQMAWTFINDSLCTTLSLQWEPEIIAVSMMYLGTRLNKLDVTDWTGRIPGSKQKWWETFIEDLSVELMEDICHQVLDLYSSQQSKTKDESPPPPPPPSQKPASYSPANQGPKRSAPSTPSEATQPKNIKAVPISQEISSSAAPKSKKSDHKPKPQAPSQTVGSSAGTQPSTIETIPTVGSYNTTYTTATGTEESYSQYNPYVAKTMYSSSFLSQEGSQSLQSIMGTMPSGPPPPPQYTYGQPPPSMPYPQGGQYAQASGYSYIAPGSAPPTSAPQQFSSNMPPPPNYPPPSGGPANYHSSAPPGYSSGYQQQYGSQGYPQEGSHGYSQDVPSQGYSQGAFPGAGSLGNPHGPPPNKNKKNKNQDGNPVQSGLATVRITGRR
ncbi:hypothetical protein ACJMK2_037468 [Sinanodonta woodiana]|uniref:Cyclin-K n=1 Tax=Sinanodonta woodiana TaxID=1069815 RepID=A0ABD3WKF4_SINWO